MHYIYAVQIHRAQYPAPAGAQFSILIPTWNNLDFLKLCIRSLRENSQVPHELIVHVNEGQDGSLAWVREQQISHTWTEENAGVCHALNAASELATTDYICYFNDDMYALPNWDLPFLEEIPALQHGRWFLSGTMIEPTDTGNPCVLAPHDDGRSLDQFRESDLLAAFRSWRMQDWTGATWPPNVVPKKLWEEVGGYSVEFSPGMSSDPDFSRKLWEVGVRYFKGLAAARVYHFQAQSTGKVVKNNGRRQFLEKWGLTQGTFNRYYLKRGKEWEGPLSDPGMHPGLWWGRIKSKLKKGLQK